MRQQQECNKNNIKMFLNINSSSTTAFHNTTSPASSVVHIKTVLNECISFFSSNEISINTAILMSDVSTMSETLPLSAQGRGWLDSTVYYLQTSLALQGIVTTVSKISKSINVAGNIFKQCCYKGPELQGLRQKVRKLELNHTVTEDWEQSL